MKKRKYGIAIVCAVSVFLIVSAFFAKDFVLYDFHMDVSDYSYSKMEGEKPQSADTAIWFSFGTNGKELYYGLDIKMQDNALTIYSLTQSGKISVIEGSKNPIEKDSLGHFIACIPAIKQDIDDDGKEETVYDYGRADLGLNAYNPAPQRFRETKIPFELVFVERKYIVVYYENEILQNADILVSSYDGEKKNYKTDEHGWIQGLPNRDIRKDFTAAYSPDGEFVYRMYYALEDYPYFSTHFFKAHIPLLVIFALTSIGIILVHFIRNQKNKRDPAYAIYSRERTGIYPSTLQQKTDSKFLLIRWVCLFAGMFLWTYAGKLIHQGQMLNEISIPVFSCPFNLDQVVEVPCYYLSHFPALFTRFGTDFPIRNMVYAVMFLMSKYYLGLDGNFTYLKAAIIKDGKVISTIVCPTGIDNNTTAKRIVAALCKKYNITRADIGYIMATGYRRKILEVADDNISEITAHAYSVRITAPKEYRPGMIVDIGGQDSKIIYLDAKYNVKNFTMNDKCAAGTGKFMEVIAQILETTIAQIGPLSLESSSPCDINSTCVVFAQSEVISLVARKFDRRDILAGMHLSMAKRIIKMMKKSEKGGDILMTGGGALNTGIHKAFEEEMMKDIYIAKYPQFNGAVGAALIASERGEI